MTAVKPFGPLAWAVLLALPFPTSAQVTQPRLTADGKALILLEEIREPPEKRQPMVTLEFSPGLGIRHIRVAGKGIVPPAAVSLQCGTETWPIARSEIRQMPEQTHAFFAVEKGVAETVLARPSCRLVLVGVQIPIPRDLLQAVWAVPPLPGAAPRRAE